MSNKDELLQDVIDWAKAAVERYEDVGIAPFALIKLKSAIDKYDEEVSKTTFYNVYDRLKNIAEPAFTGSFDECNSFIGYDNEYYYIAEKK